MWLRRRLWGGRWPGHELGAPMPPHWSDHGGEDQGQEPGKGADHQHSTAGGPDDVQLGDAPDLAAQEQAEMQQARQAFRERKQAIRAKYKQLRAQQKPGAAQGVGGQAKQRRAGAGKGRALVCRFVSHTAVEDGASMAPGQPFDKVWRGAAALVRWCSSQLRSWRSSVNII